MSNGFYRKAENGPDGGLDGRFLDRDRCQWGEAQLARRSPQNEDRGHMLWAARFSNASSSSLFPISPSLSSTAGTSPKPLNNSDPLPMPFSFSAPLPLGFSFSDPLPLPFSFSAPHTFSDRSSDFFWALNWRIPFRIVISSASLHILWNGCFFSGSAFLLFFDFLVTAGSVPLSSSTAFFLVDLAAEAEAAAGGGEVFRICSGSDPMSSDEESSVSSTGSRAFLLFFDFLVTVGSVPLTSSTALFLVDLALDFFDLEFFLAFLSDSDSESWAGIMAEGVWGWGFVAAAGGGEVFRICSGSDPISSDEEFSVSSSPEEETGSRDFAILR
ncbi:ATPase/histidine kinase/DNA gyrase B/HSP90 domain protein [Striga asiatica]|uniref:ATPase/histidine kinase/DNA gyrase B/HSP90 domain protein n=1 Tax=Striga asiatica TaxID=4170 RepID=A0A5A7QV92_STRAF|nr:ATPase/histidine kinase/DNA gyrase B/HSP90 domain protein [Striga asiatica]